MERFGGFSSIVLALIVCAAIVQIIYYFVSKRNPLITRFEKSLWRFISFSVLYIILIFVSYLHLSTVGTSSLAPPANGSIEVVVQELAKNQQQMKIELEEFREVLLFVLLMTGIYVMSALNILQQLRYERKKSSQQTIKPRPLGLELE